MKQCTCFALKAINCICAEREDENSFAHWFYGAPHRIKYLRDHPAFLAAQEAWDAAKKQEPKREWVGLTNEELEDVWPFVFRPHELGNRAIYKAIEAKLKEKNT